MPILGVRLGCGINEENGFYSVERTLMPLKKLMVRGPYVGKGPGGGLAGGSQLNFLGIPSFPFLCSTHVVPPSVFLPNIRRSRGVL